MRTTTGNVHSPTPTPSYSPSVPLHVYRELVAELQAVQAKLDVVTSHNQKLSQENQQLRQEISKVVQSCLELQKLVDSSGSSSQPPKRTQVEAKKIPNSQPQPSPRIKAEAKSATKPPVKPTPPPRQPKTSPQKNQYEIISVPVVDMNFPVSEPVFIEEQEVRYYAPQKSDLKGLSSWWLIITIVLIMITGFSAGYLVVRPLLQQSQHN
ncbi:hypothetical protein A0J48_025210 [Sphaerospermopsis aphanizomenoides BCCUSP55]|uniref:hypothetical protein n=1 Tax=Sphaerospermopsis aphanizomenoides TaxID=459663 RepID=UPI0019086DEA|nr:hypothetical protein [Sphaerospermopsis aphanizomenoides]MBK1990770.1 hypothetical protein [Sphaerospermopsis aphanizomenoides BCCUSP55]